MKIPNHLVKSFPISYENEEYVFCFYNCDSIKKEVDKMTPTSETHSFYIDSGRFFSEKIVSISGLFVIGKFDKLSKKFPYPFILDCDQPYVMEVKEGKIVKFKSLSELIVSVKEAMKGSNEKLKKIYGELCMEYDEEFVNDVLPYEDIIYYYA
ncbi:MAG: hypothetical protein K2O04_05005 [Clostridiales bacterium]|nr:hypothetical protein [Clostridiales bacterium]